MKKRKEKKAEIGSESIIIWIVVIAVVILAIIFVSRMDINTMIKNLPGFSGPEDEDKEIEGIDESMFFDCKYPIGRVSIGVEKKRYMVIRSV